MPSLPLPGLPLTPPTPPSFPSGGCANGAPGLSLFHCSVSGPHGGGPLPSPLVTRVQVDTPVPAVGDPSPTAALRPRNVHLRVASPTGAHGARAGGGGATLQRYIRRVRRITCARQQSGPAVAGLWGQGNTILRAQESLGPKRCVAPVPWRSANAHPNAPAGASLPRRGTRHDPNGRRPAGHRRARAGPDSPGP